MAKLYAELTSDKGGRVASKGGNQYISCQLAIKNETIVDVSISYNDDDNYNITITTPDGTRTENYDR